MRLLDRVEPLALQVFDQAEGGRRGVAGLDHARGDRLELQLLKRAPAAFAGDELKPVAVLAHHDRLEEALDADAFRQFAELLGGNFAPRLVRARLDQVNRDLLVAGGAGGRGSRGGG